MHESDNLNNDQKLSQLMDGEWHDLNPGDCVATLCADETLRAKWARYHMIRDVMKSEPVEADQALSMRICDAIKDEPSYSNITPFSGASVPVLTESSQAPVAAETEQATPASGDSTARVVPLVERKPSWVNTGVAGFALAASVALVTVVGLNLFEQQNAPAVPVVAGISSSVPAGNDAIPFVQGDSAVLPVVEFVANTGTGPFWVSTESSQRVSDEERLNMMLSQHIENSPTSVREGLLPYSRLVGYEESRQGR